MHVPEALRAAIGSGLAAPGIRHGLRWFLTRETIPQSWRELAHRKLAKRARFGPDATFTYVTPRGAKLHFACKGTPTYLYWRNSYEPETTSLFCALARQARTILDIGSADGIYALFAAAENPSARVIAFEPVQVASCRANLALNRPLSDRIELQAMALGDVDDELTIYVAGSGGTSSLNPEFRRVHHEQRVTVRRGDTILRELGVAKVDLIKMDTESTEPAVLRGLAEHLARDRPEIICEVLVGRTERDLEALLRPHGYQLYGISPEGLRHTQTIVGDASYRCPNYLFTQRSPGALAALGVAIG